MFLFCLVFLEMDNKIKHVDLFFFPIFSFWDIPGHPWPFFLKPAATEQILNGTVVSFVV